MRRLTLVLVLATAVAMAGCTGGGDGYGGGDGDGGAGGGGGGSGEVDATVKALDNRFDPEQIDVSENATVKWVNEGSNPHTVEIRPEGGSNKVHQAEIAPGESTRYTFQETGTFQVWCRYHGSPGSGMHMTVTVY